ncbi:MAG: DNA-binding domain-containing protein [Gammaproteobacteria bacterium]
MREPEPRTSLRHLQLALQTHLLGKPSAIADSIVDAPPLPVLERLDIYRNAYQVRLIEALDDTYPVLHGLLGDEMFVELGEEFVAAHPSVHRSIRWYGGELAEFLSTHPPYAEQPILAEIALLEWTLAEVFDSADAQPVQRAALSSLDASAWGELSFEFHPSLRRLSLHWNTVAVWQAMSRGETPPDPACADQPVPWLLWRQELQNYFRSMTADEAVALDAALHGKNFGDLCEALAEYLRVEEIPLRAASLLGAWADSGMIVALD